MNNMSTFSLNNQMPNNFKNNRNFEKDTTNTGEHIGQKNFTKELEKERKSLVLTPSVAYNIQSSG